jgi:hypothetical protein
MRAVASFLLLTLAGFIVGRAVFAPWGKAPHRLPGGTTQMAHSAPDALPQKGTPRERLDKMLEGDDPLASAARLRAWLDEATLEDFRALGKDMDSLPIPNFAGFHHSFREAFGTAMMKRWLELDANGALAAANDMNERKNEYSLLSAIARLRPELILEKLPILSRDGTLAGYASAAFVSLGTRNATAARRFLEGIEKPEQRQQAAVAIASGVAQSDPVAAVALARELNDAGLYMIALNAAAQIGPGIVRGVLAAAPEKYSNSSALPSLLLRYPSLATEIPGLRMSEPRHVMSEELQRVADLASPEERERFLASYDTLPEQVRGPLAAALVSAWARTEPAQAAAWALAHAEPTQADAKANHVAKNVFLRWFHADTDAALAWWRALPESPLRNALGSDASAIVADEGRIDEALALFHPVEHGDQGEITAMLAQTSADRDPAAAAAWLGSLPAYVQTGKAVGNVIERWFARDAESVANWVEALPAGKRRDQALTKFIGCAAQQSSANAAEWVQQIADSRSRQNAAAQLYWSWSREDPAAARVWIRGLPGVDTEWHERFLRASP